MLAGILILFFPVFSPAFYSLYLCGGLSDMLDGFVARRTNTVSEFGSKFDTVSDFVFISCCLMKIVPVLVIPGYLIVWTIVIALVKVVNIVSGFIYLKHFPAVHSVLNKISGLLLFLLPLSLPYIDLTYSSLVVFPVLTLAAVQEGHLIRTFE